jgi:hypothetical protein
MTMFFKAYPTKVMNDFSVFRHLNSEGKLVLRTDYQDLACAFCGKINELEAIARGLPRDISLSTNLDVVESFDHMLIISSRVKSILEEICDSDVVFHCFPSTGAYYLLMPRVFIHASEGDSAFTVVGTCKKCARYTEVVWGPSVPTVESKQIMAYQLESRLGLMPSWVVSRSVVTVLKAQKPKLRGLLYDSLC